MKLLLKILRYIIGIIFILLAILSIESYISYNDYYYLAMSFSLILISLLFLPIFDIISSKLNRNISVFKKIILCIITIFIPAIIFEIRDTTNILELIISLILTIILWILIILLSKKTNN